jgi:thymidylate synthase (FAD)
MPESQIQVTLIDYMGNDDSIASAARVSFGKNASHYTKEQNSKLLSYLAKHKHMSPFGHVFLSFHIKAPIFVHAQLLKHKFLRANTISRRYVDSDIEFYQPDVWRGRSEDKKQGSSGEAKTTTEHSIYGKVGDDSLEFAEYHDIAMNIYSGMIEDGVAPEMARMVLPQSLMTEWYWSGSLDAFADMCRLRIQEDSQYESRVVANQVYKLMKGVFPVAAPLLVEGFVDVN